MAQLRRDPFAQDRAAAARAARQAQREAMTSEQIDATMLRIARDKIASGEPIAMDDFLRANLPRAAVETHFSRVLAQARAEREAGAA